jgi:hypothetical protein
MMVYQNEKGDAFFLKHQCAIKPFLLLPTIVSVPERPAARGLWLTNRFFSPDKCGFAPM